MQTVHLVIKGKVQGVFYRATAKKVAQDLGLTGWVKNTNDGNVEATATGDEGQIKAFADWCAKGPSGALVTAVDVNYVALEDFEDFSILRR